jgi:hypothetical protein
MLRGLHELLPLAALGSYDGRQSSDGGNSKDLGDCLNGSIF